MVFLFIYLLCGVAAGIYVHGAVYGYFSRRFASLGYDSAVGGFRFGITMGVIAVFAWPIVLVGMFISVVGFGGEYGLRFAPPRKP